MFQVTEEELKKRLTFANPWWETGKIPDRFAKMPRRAFFDAFYDLLTARGVNRAVVLMGPRRVGKTVMLTQAVQELLDNGLQAEQIIYISVDTPTFTGLSLERLLDLFLDMHGHGREDPLFILYDEIQYHADWERHLKSLVDSYPDYRFVASGSAAAALKMKSQESGAGRFTDFLLPPLLFSEFLAMTGKQDWLQPSDKWNALEDKISEINAAFIDYLNYGGFPEAVAEPAVKERIDRYVADDIVDKVLLRDIPSLYGISDSHELKRFFTVLAYNTGNEISLQELSKASGVAKNTLRKFLDYLEAAFLIIRVPRIDENARRFKRATHFKVYLTNPSMRAALFGPIGADDDAMGRLAETAYVAHYVVGDPPDTLFYARWKDGEVDFVQISMPDQGIVRATEVKWSDRSRTRIHEELWALLTFCKKNGLSATFMLTKEFSDEVFIDDIRVRFRPVSLSCLLEGRSITRFLNLARDYHEGESLQTL